MAAHIVPTCGCRDSNMARRKHKNSLLADTYFAGGSLDVDTQVARRYSANRHCAGIPETGWFAAARGRRRFGRDIVAVCDTPRTRVLQLADTAKWCAVLLRPEPSRDLRSMSLGFPSYRGLLCGRHPSPELRLALLR